MISAMKSTGAGVAPLDVAHIRQDFPALHQTVHGKPLVYLDNAATMQKPRAVIDATIIPYARDCANVHRGVHELSMRATAAYEMARHKVKELIHAADVREIVFVRGTTEAINLVAQTFGRQRLGAGDEVLITGMEHHSNIVPWQILCQQVGATLRVVPITDTGEIRLEDVAAALTARTRLASVVHVSNALGTVNPVAEIVALCHERGVPVLLDGAQAVAHMPVDVQALGCDFYAFSGHKLCGPTGVGVLYGRYQHLASMPPYQGGGEMIKSVTFEKTIYDDPPARFEAGTPNIAGVIGLGAAVDYVRAIGLDRIEAYERSLLAAATEALERVGGVRFVGTAPGRHALVSFLLDGIHPHDVGSIVDREGVAIRTGHHCAQPVMERFACVATSRASFAFYNTFEEIEALAAALRKVKEVLG